MRSRLPSSEEQAAALALDDDGRVESRSARSPTRLRLLEDHGIAATLAHRRERERVDVNAWTVSGLSGRQGLRVPLSKIRYGTIVERETEENDRARCSSMSSGVRQEFGVMRRPAGRRTGRGPAWRCARPGTQQREQRSGGGGWPRSSALERQHRGLARGGAGIRRAHRSAAVRRSLACRRRVATCCVMRALWARGCRRRSGRRGRSASDRVWQLCGACGRVPRPQRAGC